jgi:phosphatidylserine decarboxylase
MDADLGTDLRAGLRAGLWDNLAMDTHSASPGLGARAFVALQHVLPQHTISRIVHAATRSQTPWFKDLLIDAFMRGFAPDLSDAVRTDPRSYESFNAFFTRALQPGARPLPADPAALACPVDGTVSELGDIDDDRLLQAKGRHYTLSALLAGREDWVARFRGGRFATIYLAPYNYHRIHMAWPGTLSDAWFVPGRLFSVNRTTADGVANLFARNERVNLLFEHRNADAGVQGSALHHALLLIGALNVGSMETVWHGEVAPRRPRRLERLPVVPSAGGDAFAAARGEEIARFNMGSTVILLFPPGAVEWRAGLASGTTVRMGEVIGRRLGGGATADAPAA